jgi:signal transduction histidine kinase
MRSRIRSTALGNLTYLTLEEAESPQLVRKYMKLAEEQVAMLNRLAAQTLGMARSSGPHRPEALHILIECALRVHRKNLEAKQIHLVKKLQEDLVAKVHAGEIVQIISNLIANSLDAMPTNGTLGIHLSPHPHGVCIVVSDKGLGISKAKAIEIFKPFYTTKDTGTGLGLHISKKIVEGHRGTISMQSSVRPGKSGTTFTISLPIQ